MKFLMTFLSVLAVAACAHADRILIYNGNEVATLNSRAISRANHFLIFDLDTLQYESIEYGGATSSDYYYSASTPVAFVYSPITVSSNSSQTYFAFGSNSSNAGFSSIFGFYSGTNSIQNLGGTFSGQFPASMTYSSYVLNGDGTIGNDKLLVNSGHYSLNTKLTTQSNAGNFNLTTAISMVTGFLSSRGYAAE